MNWGGDEGVSVPDMVTHLAGRLGREAAVEQGADGIHQYWLDPTKRIALAGACKVPWREGFDRMLRARHPEVALAD